jgi:enoyl-CoA hydratase/carnithine racemase|tara:strand:+ start:2531 stop:3400 length:870 start_codon:yes stop_codon:yes gene_type:complete
LQEVLIYTILIPSKCKLGVLEMSFVETEVNGQIYTIRLNRPERLNALSTVIREGMAKAFTRFHEDDNLEVAILTGTGRGFCAGEDMKESVERGIAGSPKKMVEKDLVNPFQEGTLQKPVIAAVNGFAMGGGFMLVERTDLRVAVKSAIFEMSEAKRWLLGGYNHGHYGNLPHPIATEMAFGYRITAERMHQVGFINRLVEEEDLMKEAYSMAEHLLTLPPASRVNTLYMMKHMAPQIPENIAELAEKLHLHGDTEDRMESRRAFAEKRKPNYKGWLKPEDRYNMPKLKN